MISSETIGSPSSERAILSIIIKDVERIAECDISGLSPEMFSVMANKIIYNVLGYLFQQEVNQIDSTLIYSTIEREDYKVEIDNLGGLQYIDMLIQAVVVDNLRLYVNKVKENYQLRLVHELGHEMKVKTTEYGANVSEIISELQSKTLDLAVGETAEKQEYKMGANAKDRLKDRADNKALTAGFALGWATWDRHTGGLCGNDLTVIVAPSKTGKSMLLMNWAKILSYQCDIKGVYVDTEMNSDEQEDRLISSVSGVPLEELRNGMFAETTEFGTKEDKMQRVNEAIELIESGNLIHVYMPDFTPEKVSALIRKLHLTEGIQYAFFDYIKLPQSGMDKNMQEYQLLGNFTTALKDLSGILNIPIVTAAQATREAETATEFSVSMVGGSYRIVQMATRICFLRNKTATEMANEGYAYGNQLLTIELQRNGSSGGIKCHLQNDKAIIRVKEV